jgi:hypothetical protein
VVVGLVVVLPEVLTVDEELDVGLGPDDWVVVLVVVGLAVLEVVVVGLVVLEVVVVGLVVLEIVVGLGPDVELACKFLGSPLTVSSEALLSFAGLGESSSLESYPSNCDDSKLPNCP